MKKLTQEEAASRMGIVRSTYANYESGKREPDFDTATKMADFYDVNVGWLLTGENEKGNVYTLPDSEYERIIKEAEAHFKVDLHDDPVVLAAVRQMIQMLAEAKAKDNR